MGTQQARTISRGASRPAAWFGCALALAGACLMLPAHGQTSAAPANKSTASVRSQPTRPAWKDLTDAQRQALQPLAAHWDSLPQERKNKWLALSRNYYAMPPAEQAKLQARMREWVQLSQQQRTQARLNYAASKKLTPEQKAAQWQAYQQLSTEEKRRLATKAANKHTGVATVKLAEPHTLSHLPSRQAPRPEADTRTTTSLIDRDTLLPRRTERIEHAERVERPERPEQIERPERLERIERPERPERPVTGHGL